MCTNLLQSHFLSPDDSFSFGDDLHRHESSQVHCFPRKMSSPWNSLIAAVQVYLIEKYFT